MLILGELTCWTIFGLHKSDPRLITLGLTGVVASTLMLSRMHRKGGTANADYAQARDLSQR